MIAENLIMKSVSHGATGMTTMALAISTFWGNMATNAFGYSTISIKYEQQCQHVGTTTTAKYSNSLKDYAVALADLRLTISLRLVGCSEHGSRSIQRT